MARTNITTNKRLVVRDMGKSGSFDGTTSFCTVPITPSTAGFSFGMWLKLDRGIGNNARILDWQESGPTNGFTYIVTLTGSRISIQPRFYNAGSLDGQPTAYEPNTNDWVHTVVTYEPNNLKFYINGTLWSQDTSITMNASATTLTLGKRTGGGFATGYKGLIDGFTFVNGRAMTADEVTSLYTAGQHPDDTTCHIRFNDNVNDETKNKNNLTATGLTYSTNVPITIRSTFTIPSIRKVINGNLLFNGDFEYLPASNTPMTSAGGTFIDGTATGSSTNTYGWYVYNYSGTRSAQFDTTTSYSGNGSLKLTTNGGTIGVSEAATASWAKNNISCEPNTSYTYSFWVKTNYISGDATTATRFRILQATSAWTVGAGAAIVGVTGLKTSQDWTQYTGTFTTSTTARFLQINMQIVGNDGTATLNMEAWFDNVSITPSSPPRQNIDNLVFNGDFEFAPPFTAATNVATRWIDGTASGKVDYSGYGWAILSITGTASAQFDNTVSKIGNNSLKISTNATSSVISAANMRIDSSSGFKLENIIRVQPSTSYTLSYWMKTNLVSGTATDGAQMRLSRYDSTGTFIAVLQANTPVKTTTDWTQYTYTFTTTSTTNFITVRPVIVGNTGTGTLIMDAWFDDIILTQS